MTDRKLVTEEWTNNRGETFQISRWPWESETPADTMLLIHHGLGEHAGRYHRFALGLSELPIEIWSYDLRGHGKSVGPRGHADGLDGLVDDLEVMIGVALEKTKVKQFFLMGHSLGGATVVHYLARRRLHKALVGALLSAAPSRIEKTLPIKIKLAIGSVLGRIMPKLALGNGLDPNGISSIPGEVTAYNEDPLVHDKISAALGLSLTSDGEKNLANAGKIELPLLIWAGEDDSLVNPDDSRALFAAASSKDKTIKMFPGARHEVHSESQEKRAELCDLVHGWIKERMG